MANKCKNLNSVITAETAHSFDIHWSVEANLRLLLPAFILAVFESAALETSSCTYRPTPLLRFECRSLVFSRFPLVEKLSQGFFPQLWRFLELAGLGERLMVMPWGKQKVSLKSPRRWGSKNHWKVLILRLKLWKCSFYLHELKSSKILLKYLTEADLNEEQFFLLTSF